MGYLFAGAYTVQDHLFLPDTVFRYDERYGPADDLNGGIAKYAFSRTIPAGNNAFQCFADNRILRIVYDGQQPAVCTL